jgi:hypothetical protein
MHRHPTQLKPSLTVSRTHAAERGKTRNMSAAARRVRYQTTLFSAELSRHQVIQQLCEYSEIRLFHRGGCVKASRFRFLPVFVRPQLVKATNTMPSLTAAPGSSG